MSNFLWRSTTYRSLTSSRYKFSLSSSLLLEVMWKKLLVLQNNNHCREKHDCYTSLQKIQARPMVHKHYLPAYSRMLHLNKKNTWWSSYQQCKHTGWKRQTMHTTDRYGLKFCEKLTHCAEAEGHVGQCDCFWRSHIWYTSVHPIKLVHLWKILVHPGVYDTPGRQALSERKFIQQYSRTRGLLQLRKRYQLFRWGANWLMQWIYSS